MLFVEDYSRMMTVMFLKKKSNEFQMFKWYLARVEKEIGKSMKCLRSNKEVSSHQENLRCSVMIKELKDKHQNLVLPHIMVLQKEETDQ